MAPTDAITPAEKPKYTEAEKKHLIELQFAGLSSGTIAPQYAYKDIVAPSDDEEPKRFDEYYKRFLNHELTPEDLIKYDGDFIRALKEKDRQDIPDILSDKYRTTRDAKAHIQSRNLTDLGNAERLVDQYGLEIRYCHQFLSWFIWDYPEGRWRKDQNGLIFRIAKDVARRILVESASAPMEEKRKALASWAFQCENRTHLNGMVELAQNEKSVIIAPDELDADDYLFNLRNGTFNLKTFELQEHSKRLNITRLADYDYDPTAQCPAFKKYLDRTFISNPDKEKIIAYIQRALGYTLTGSVDEQCLFILYGSGANGKSVLINIVKALLGEYGTTTQSKTFTTDRGEISNDIAALAGCRFVCASENSTDSKLDESIIKQLTGGDSISARFLHQEFFTYEPKFKIWWCFNHPPAISDMTVSIWRRIKILPFTEKIPESEWDKKLADKIIASELSGVFNWAIEGLKNYYKNGLQEPGVVTKATKTYKDDQDILADFFNTKFEFTESERDEIKASILYESYKQWWNYVEPSNPLSSTKFGRLCRDRGMNKIEKSSGMFYTNIKIRKN